MRKYCKVDRAAGTKQCPECDVVKKVDEFPYRGNGTIYPYCKPCNTARAVAWSKANKERKNAGEKERRKKNPEKFLAQSRKAHYKRRYGIAYSSVLETLEKQSFRCEICSEKICENTLYVDHCHNEGHIRGVLCNRCNIGLASIERPGYLDAALAYLESHRSRS